jgi:hypothetical protein
LLISWLSRVVAVRVVVLRVVVVVVVIVLSQLNLLPQTLLTQSQLERVGREQHILPEAQMAQTALILFYNMLLKQLHLLVAAVVELTQTPLQP